MKTTYLAYATTGREFDVTHELEQRGLDVWCGKKVDFVRRGKKRRPEPIESPKLPNYVFISMDEAEWHELSYKPVKYLAKYKYPLHRRDDVVNLEKFQRMVDGIYYEGLRVAERNNAAEMWQFKRGQKLVDTKGRFGEQLLVFRQMIDGDIPEVEAEAEMMGQIVKVRLDPLDVKSYEG